jgi:hypothetical protein
MSQSPTPFRATALALAAALAIGLSPAAHALTDYQWHFNKLNSR